MSDRRVKRTPGGFAVCIGPVLIRSFAKRLRALAFSHLLRTQERTNT